MFDQIEFLPGDWQARQGYIAPGDLSSFAPEGFGGVPLIVRPWDKLEDAASRGGYYGLQTRTADPIKSAPAALDHGGTIYFDRFEKDSGFGGVMKTLRVPEHWNKYVAFLMESTNTVEDRYLVQMRLVGFGALSQLYGIPGAVIDALPEQKLSIDAAIMAFLRHQTEYWRGEYMYSEKLAGSLGGDGDWAKEDLAFGLTVENGFWNVYRVWSRPWLVTK